VEPLPDASTRPVPTIMAGRVQPLPELRLTLHEHLCRCGATWACAVPCRLTLYVHECHECAEAPR